MRAAIHFGNIHGGGMSEASVLGGAGQLETAKTVSPLQLIIDNEIFGIAKRIRAGLAVDDETLDWDEVIAGIDQDPAFSFLMSEHTFRHYTEAHRPDMFNRDGVTNWERGGSKTLEEKALEKFHAIMCINGQIQHVSMIPDSEELRKEIEALL